MSHCFFMQTAKTDQTGQMGAQVILLVLSCSGSFALDNKRDFKCSYQISYRVREDIYKYFVNARSFKCLHAACSVLRNIKNQMGDRMTPCII